MDSSKAKLVSLSALVLGIGIGVAIARYAPTPVPSQIKELDACEDRYDRLKGKLEVLNDVDFEEYMRLKDAEQRYKKADEILGKIIQIFLADLGLKVRPEKLEAFQTKVNQPETVSQSAAVTQPSNAASTATTGVSQAATTTANESEALKNIFAKESELYRVRTPEEIKEFLKSVSLPNFTSRLQAATPPTHDQLRAVSGRFYGNIVFDDPRKPPAGMEWFVQARVDNGNPRGHLRITLTENGRQVSRRDGDGELTDFFALDSESPAVLVNVRGGTGYVQLYYLRAWDQLIGNYYTKVREGEYRRDGEIILRRRIP